MGNLGDFLILPITISMVVHSSLLFSTYDVDLFVELTVGLDRAK